MKFASTLSLASLVSIAIAAIPETVTLQAIRSGSPVQYSSITEEGDKLYVGATPNDSSAQQVSLLLDESTGALTNKADNKKIVVDNGVYTAASEGESSGYSIKDNYLIHGDDGFIACPNGDGQYLLTTECDAPADKQYSIALHAAATKVAKRDLIETKIDAFGVISIHSGSKVQNAGITKDATNPHKFYVGGNGEFVTLHLNDGILSDQDGKKIAVSADGVVGEVPPTGRSDATKGFSIDAGHLLYLDAGFYACPEGDNFFLSAANCAEGVGISLLIV